MRRARRPGDARSAHPRSSTVPAGHRDGAGIGPGLDPVGDHLACRGAMQPSPPPRSTSVTGADMPSMRAPIAIRQWAEVNDLGLARSIAQNGGRPVGQGLAAITRFSVAPTETIGKHDSGAPAARPATRRHDIAGIELDLGTQLLQALSGGYRPAACRCRSRRAGRPAPHGNRASKRSEHQEGGAHLAHDVVRRLRVLVIGPPSDEGARGDCPPALRRYAVLGEQRRSSSRYRRDSARRSEAAVPRSDSPVCHQW